MVTINGHTLELKEYSCSYKDQGPMKSDEYVNIYVRLQNVCNAKCPFCEFTGKKQEFNFWKLVEILEELGRKCRINKVSFTGGEPTLDFHLFEQAVKTVHNLVPKAALVVNTNGYNLEKLFNSEIYDYFHSIALSRHHYNDDINNHLFGDIATINSNKIMHLMQSKSTKKIHLSCNLIKNFIDSDSEVVKYLEFANSLCIDDIGFVSLMPANQFCKDSFVDFESINFKDHMLPTAYFRNGENCRCNNYKFLPKQSGFDTPLKIYARFYCKSDNNQNNLVYDHDTLRVGFNGKILK